MLYHLRFIRGQPASWLRGYSTELRSRAGARAKLRFAESVWLSPRGVCNGRPKGLTAVTGMRSGASVTVTSSIPTLRHANRHIMSSSFSSSTRTSLSQHLESARRADQRDRNKNSMLYLLSTVIGVVGLSYAAVPMYKLFCQATGFGGETQRSSVEKFQKMTPSTSGRLLRITFNADTSDAMPWSFKPCQRVVEVHPGETALAFFKAKNKTDRPVTGVATYNVTPMRAGVYFNKIQCFCFEEQRLKPNEEVDMPVFFYVDPEMEDDPHMDGVKTLTLSYTFFPSKHDDELG